MSKTFFLTLNVLFLLLMSSCNLVSQKGFAPKEIRRAVLYFKTQKVYDNINQDFLNKEAYYEFGEHGTYKLYLDNQYHSQGSYAYKKLSPNIAHLVISYTFQEHNVYYVVYLHFNSLNEGTFRASSQNTSINDMIATFHLENILKK